MYLQISYTHIVCVCIYIYICTHTHIYILTRTYYIYVYIMCLMRGYCIGGGHGNPLQHSCLEKLMVRGAWWATVHGVAKGWT